VIRFATATLLAALACACGTSGGSLAQPSATPTAAPPSTPTATDTPAPSLLPGSSVRLTVNGVDVSYAATITLAGGPTTIRIVFPVDIDRSTVDPYLPRGASVTWTDDRTVSLVIPANEPNPAFKVAGAMSKDGRTMIEFFVLNLMNPPSTVLSTYTVAELLAQRQPPKPDAPRIPGTRAQVSPASDSKQVLSALFGDPPVKSFARVLDLVGGRVQELSLPSGPLTLGGWAGTDRIVVVTDRVWAVPVDGSAPRPIAEVTALGTPMNAAASPKGTYVAVVSKDRLGIVTLASGAVRSVATVTTACNGMHVNAPGLAWSPDETRLAVSDCVTPSGDQVRTRILEPATGATAAVIEGGVYGIRSMLSGDLMVSRESGQSGEGARTLWILFSFGGNEKSRLLGYAPTLSPDGRYVLDGTCCAGEGFTLAALGTDPDHATSGSAVWLPDGRVLAMTR